jgi:hypothetical protein
MAEQLGESRSLVRKPEHVFAVRRAESGLRVKINGRAGVMDLPLE